MQNFINSIVEFVGQDKTNQIKEYLLSQTKPLFDACNSEDTTSLSDLLFLSLLVSYYKPNKIVEVGTWVGSSTLALAYPNQECKVFTCDNNDRFVFQNLEPYTRIFIHPNTYSTQFLKEIHPEKNIDMFFNDAIIDEIDCELMIDMASNNFIFATHDYYDQHGNHQKGNWVMEIFKNALIKNSIKFTELIPERSWYFGDRINGCCGLLICQK